MAKIVCEFDTVAKTMAVTMDGKAVDNVMGCSLYKNYDGEYSCTVSTGETNKDEKTTKVSYLYASESIEGKQLPDSSKSKTFVGFKEASEIVTHSNVAEDIANYFAK